MTRWRTRTVGALDLVWGAILLARRSRVFVLVAGREPTEVEQVAMSVLGGRHLAEAAMRLGLPTRARRLLVGVDLTHAASMVALAARSPQHRRPAGLSALSSTGFAVLAVLAGRRDGTADRTDRAS